MKRRSLYFILTIALITSLAGCGHNTATVATKVTDTEDVKDEDDSDDEDEDANEGEDEESADESEESEEIIEDDGNPILNVTLTKSHMGASDTSTGQYRFASDVTFTKVGLSGKDAKRYPELAKVLKDAGDELYNNQESELNRLRDKYIEYTAEDSSYIPAFTNSLSRQVLRADNKVLSVLNNSYTFEGGVHGFYMIYGEAYDVKSGKLLTLSDVITDENAFADAVKTKLEAKYDSNVFLVDLNTCFDDVKNGRHDLNWSMDYSGVTVYFEPYEIASYADGVLSVRFSYKEDASLFNEAYVDAPEDYITPVTTWTETNADINNDGKDEMIKLVGVEEEDMDYCDWKLFVDGREIQDTNAYGYSNDSYLIKKGDKFFVYMITTGENDWSDLQIADIVSGTMLGDTYGVGNYGLHDSEYGRLDDGYWQTTNALTDPNCFELDTGFYVLGTYNGTRTYHVADNGMPESEDEFFVAYGINNMIQSVKELSCKVVDKEGNILEENATLPQGTMLRIIRTDGKTRIDLQAWDYAIEEDEYFDDEYPIYTTNEPVDLDKGIIYRIEFYEEDYQQKVNGEFLDNFFKGMLYAG